MTKRLSERARELRRRACKNIEQNMRQSEVNEHFAEYEQNKLNENFNQSISRQTRKNLNVKSKNRITSETINTFTNNVFEKLLTESFFNSLVLDESFKDSYYDSLKGFFKSNLNGFVSMEELKESNIIFKELFTECRKTVDDIIYLRRVKKLPLLNEAGEIDLTNDEKEKIKDIPEKTNIDELSSIVKDKVTSVIQTENELEKKRKEEIDQIRAEVEGIGGTEQEIQERFNRFVSKKINENYTVYKTVFVKNLLESKQQEDKDVNVDLDLVSAQSMVEYTLMEYLSVSDIKRYSSRELSEFKSEIQRKSKKL